MLLDDNKYIVHLTYITVNYPENVVENIDGKGMSYYDYQYLT